MADRQPARLGNFAVPLLSKVAAPLTEQAAEAELCWILGDGVDQAADISWFATSIPSRNFTPRTIFGN